MTSAGLRFGCRARSASKSAIVVGVLPSPMSSAKQAPRPHWRKKASHVSPVA